MPVWISACLSLDTCPGSVLSSPLQTGLQSHRACILPSNRSWQTIFQSTFSSLHLHWLAMVLVPPPHWVWSVLALLMGVSASLGNLSFPAARRAAYLVSLNTPIVVEHLFPSCCRQKRQRLTWDFVWCYDHKHFLISLQFFKNVILMTA